VLIEIGNIFVLIEIGNIFVLIDWRHIRVDKYPNRINIDRNWRHIRVDKTWSRIRGNKYLSHISGNRNESRIFRNRVWIFDVSTEIKIRISLTLITNLRFNINRKVELRLIADDCNLFIHIEDEDNRLYMKFQISVEEYPNYISILDNTCLCLGLFY
jgi:hypothetical protein